MLHVSGVLGEEFISKYLGPPEPEEMDVEEEKEDKLETEFAEEENLEFLMKMKTKKKNAWCVRKG